jgi:hypothetical protein
MLSYLQVLQLEEYCRLWAGPILLDEIGTLLLEEDLVDLLNFAIADGSWTRLRAWLEL